MLVRIPFSPPSACDHPPFGRTLRGYTSTLCGNTERHKTSLQRTLTVYIKYAFVGQYRQQQNGRGSLLLSLRAMAFWASCPVAVAATYSMMRSLDEEMGEYADAIGERACTHKKALRVTAWGRGQER